MDPQQVAKTARKIQRAFIKCPTMQDNPTPASLAANSMTYAIAMESAIDRYLAEHAEPTPEPETVPTKSPRPWIKFGDPENDPKPGQDCWVSVRYSDGDWDVEEGDWTGEDWWTNKGCPSFGAFPVRKLPLTIYWCDLQCFDDADAALESISALNP